MKNTDKSIPRDYPGLHPRKPGAKKKKKSKSSTAIFKFFWVEQLFTVLPRRFRFGE